MRRAMGNGGWMTRGGAGDSGGAMAGTASAETIDQWRAEIDRIDAQVVALLNRRAECALAIGRIKRREHKPVHVPERERAVIARAVQLNAGPLTSEAVAGVFETIIAKIRALEENP
jgi:monofunctional chorismate mutase